MVLRFLARLQKEVGLILSWIGRVIYHVFDLIEALINVVSRAVEQIWRSLKTGPLQSVVFAVILVITGLKVVITATAEEFDELLAGLEKSFMSVALLVMVALSFLDYLRR